MSISIADIQIDLKSQLTVDELGIRHRYSTFFGKPQNPLYHIDLTWSSFSAPFHFPVQLIFDPGEIWKMYRHGSDYYVSLCYRNTHLPFSQQDMFHTNDRWNKIQLVERPTGPSWKSLLNVGAGELILRTAVLFTQGLVFHASGIDDHGKGVLFVGHSGAGKTTQVCIWQKEENVKALNDDRVVVRVTPQGIISYGTPWGGTAEIANNHSVPLRAIFVLEQAKENSIHPVPISKIFQTLLPRVFLPYWDSDLMDLAMNNLQAIIERVPVYFLKCRPEREVIPMVRSLL